MFPPSESKLTYPAALVGCSAVLDDLDSHPQLARQLSDGGFHTLVRSRDIGHGTADLDRAVDNLLSGRAHRLAGAPLRRTGGRGGGAVPLSATDPLTVDDVVTVTPGRGLLTPLRSPCLVLSATGSERDPETGAEMIYGTLPGHVECGEERFAVSSRPDGTVTATVTAFSRPGRWITRLGGPVGRHVQSRMADAYIRGIGADR